MRKQPRLIKYLRTFSNEVKNSNERVTCRKAYQFLSFKNLRLISSQNRLVLSTDVVITLIGGFVFNFNFQVIIN